jgi:hypothetical protein
VTWQLDLNNADLPRSEKNFKFGVRKVPNPDRDFFRKFLAVSKNIGSFFGFFLWKNQACRFFD